MDDSHIINQINILEFVQDLYSWEYTTLNKDWYMGSCIFPGHLDASPSFGINPEQKRYNCFVCSGGNIINLVSKIEGLSYKQSIQFLLKYLSLDGDNLSQIKFYQNGIINIISKLTSHDDLLPGGLTFESYYYLLSEKFKKNGREDLFEELDDVFITQDYKKIKKFGERYE